MLATNVVLQPTDVVHDLCVLLLLLESDLTLKQHANRVASTCFLRLHCLKHDLTPFSLQTQ